MLTQERQEKSKAFEAIQRQNFDLGYNAIFEKEKWVIPEGWVGRGEFESFERVVKEKPKKITIIRNKKLVEIDLFSEKERLEEHDSQIAEINKIKEQERIDMANSKNWRSDNFKPTEDIPF